MKKNNFLKCLGVGALCLAGTLTITGCSTEGLTTEQVATIIDTVEQSNEFMNNTTEELKRFNDFMISNESTEYSKQEAADMATVALTKLVSNYNDCLSNFHMGGSYVQNGELLEGIEVYIYKNEDVFAIIETHADGRVVIDFSIDGGDNAYSYTSNKEGTTKVKLNEEESNFYTILGQRTSVLGFNSTSDKLTQDEISYVEVLDNGNVKLTCCRIEENRKLCAVFEISSDCNFVSMGCDEYEKEEGVVNYTSESMNVDFGKLTEAGVRDLLNDAIEANLSE